MARIVYKSHILIRRWEFTFLLLCAVALSPAQAGNNSMLLTITTEVVSQPCSLRPGDETILVDFGDILNKELLVSGRTQATEFQLHLEDCDPSTAKNVRVTFSGQKSDEDDKLLALADNSATKGIAIGFELSGVPLPLNQKSNALALVSGSNVISVGTYVKLLPSGVTNIIPGAFNASANFLLEYE